MCRFMLARPRVMFLLLRRQPRSTLFPYTTLFRSLRYESVVENYDQPLQHDFTYTDTSSVPKIFTLPRPDPVITDRKSTRLNSSHVAISYAVFCLKQKTNTNSTDRRKRIRSAARTR